MRSFFSLAKRFRGDQGGNIAVIFGLALVPLISAVGCAIDYTEAVRIKSKLQSAADAAAVASISQQSNGWLAASKMTSDGEVTVAETDASNIFKGNINSASNLFTLNTAGTTTTVTKSGANLTATVAFSANVPVTFMKIIGITQMTVAGSSSASAQLPLYLDFYVAVDVSSSMGLPSTPAEAVRMQSISPDNWVQYRTGCTLACHFAPQNSACTDPNVTSPTNPPSNPSTSASYTQQYNTNGYCMGYIYSRVNQPALSSLLARATTKTAPKQVPGLPKSMLTNLNNSLTGTNSFITGNTASTSDSLTAVTSCPTAGTDDCIQLRLDAVGVALNATQATNGVDGLFATAMNPIYQQLPQQFRIGLFPFITKMNTTDTSAGYALLTSAINANPNTVGTINYAAVNLASLLDTNTNSLLGSGGTHIDVGLHSLNGVIVNVGTGGTQNNPLPYIFLITDGAQDPQSKVVPNGGWSGSNHAVTLGDSSNQFPTICTTIKNRGIMISVLNIPYQKISPVNASFANDEDDYANNNIPNIPKSLKNCASPPDAQGVGYYYEASSPDQITAALKAMFQHALSTAHITH
jgi:Flp pilus assembly protein TadG